MRSASHDPFAPLVRVLAWVGLAGLAALTLVDRGATRMYVTPWTWILVATLAAPLAALLVRTLLPGRPFQFPSPAWLILAGASALVPFASALASPYRAASLLWSATPLSAVAAFLLVHDWLASDPERNRLWLERALALAAILVTLASTILWLGDVVVAARGGYLAQVLTVIRNIHPLGHPNYTAGLMLLGLPWLVLAAHRSRGGVRLVLIAVALLALGNLFTSGSRGGLLGLAALGVGGVAAARLGWRKFTLVAAGAFALVAILAVANPRIRSMVGPSDPAAEPNLSNVQRTAMAQAGWLMGHDRPLLGWGPGTTPLTYPRYRHALDGGAENVLQLHSVPFQWWAETGALGLLVGAVLGILVVISWRRSPVAAITLAGYGVFSLTDYQADIPVFAAAGAALLALLAKPAAAPSSSVIRRSVAIGALACVTVIVGLGQRDPTPRLNVAALALARDQSQHDRAVAMLNESLRINPDQEIAHFNLGWLLVVPDPAAAESHFLAAAHLVPDKGGVYFGLGLARLNQGDNAGAARAFALECLNEPLFLASPWWNIPAIADRREATRAEYTRMLSSQSPAPKVANPWVEKQQALLLSLAPRLGQVSAGDEKAYRRDRIGYPVLMRDSDLPVPTDLYDVREDPRFPASVPFPLPSKGWLPSPRLLNLLDAP